MGAIGLLGATLLPGGGLGVGATTACPPARLGTLSTSLNLKTIPAELTPTVIITTTPHRPARGSKWF